MIKNILIVDDEALARSRLLRFFSEVSHEFPEFEFKFHEAQNGFEALEALAANKIDLVFLDIQMPEMTGFEFLQRVEKRSFQLVFQTGHDEFALKAFEESAIDYLLKPFSRERFQQSLSRALGRKTAHDLERDRESMGALNSALKKNGQWLTRISFKQNGKLRILACSEIYYFESKDHYTIAVTPGGEQIVDLSIAHLSENLDPKDFIQVHRSAIAALSQIRMITGTENSEVELSCGKKLPLSRGKRKSVLEKLNA